MITGRNATGLLALALLAFAARADEIHLRDGRILMGRVTARIDGRTFLRCDDGSRLELPTAEVVRVVKAKVTASPAAAAAPTEGRGGKVAPPKRKIAEDPDEKALALRRRRLESRLKRQVSLMFQLDEKRTRKAHQDLVRFARAESIEGLEGFADRLLPQALAWQAEARRALLEVRLQEAKVVGWSERSLSLGNGSAVRIQLPELRLTSIGTTVVVPTN